MHSIVITLLLFVAPLNVYGIDCWCQKGPATYQELVDNSYSTSSYTNCYLTGNNPSSNTCYDATCPGGDWVKGNSYASGETLVSATDGDDCISQCSALGGDYNIANMYATCGRMSNDDNSSSSSSDGGAIGGAIAGVIVFGIIVCLYYRQRGDNTNPTYVPTTQKVETNDDKV